MKDLIDGGLSYGDLLAMLRKDLQLDLKTDVLLHSATSEIMDPAYVDGTATTPSLRTLGTGAQQASPGTSLQAPTAVAQPVPGVGTIRQPSATRVTFVYVEHNFVCGGGQTESYQVLIGSANPPTTLIDEPFLSVAAGGATVQSVNSASFLVPAGWFYQVKQITHTGTGAFRWTEFTL